MDGAFPQNSHANWRRTLNKKVLNRRSDQAQSLIPRHNHKLFTDNNKKTLLSSPDKANDFAPNAPSAATQQ